MSAALLARGRTRDRPGLTAALRLLGALAGALLAGGLLLALFGHDPLAAGLTMADGAFGSSYRIAITLNRAAPYLLAATGVALCHHAGLLNLGAEGQIALGGLAIALVVLPDGRDWRYQLAALALAIAAGAAWSGLAGVLLAVRRVPVVLSTLLLNAVGLLLVGMCCGRGLASRGATPRNHRSSGARSGCPR
ncbi:hypothetical protein GCM10011504_19630 [Siccirubricoccus deserti]|uniref:ABC transporter permease n=1 Tax=Siccirubricoccus deserti TaxID=2013562 RepID=A0A9X0UDB3_9PROT|nr:ABC transporter permease [Siccirubricoccus deserti]MBC4015388.1 ABC transporter permease [Siccirubricoccus deserti]GGC41246.1 hypothetical protein GCM10011504_19630 [Siccirubricoccus deserti]